MLRIDFNLVFTVINILVLCLAVRIFLWKPVHKILDERQAAVDADLDAASKAKAEAESLVEEHKSFRANIESEKAAAVAEARKQAQAESSRIVEDAHAHVDTIVREAEASAEKRKEEILRQAQGEITEIIVAATAKVAGVPVGGDSDLYDEFLKKAGGSNE